MEVLNFIPGVHFRKVVSVFTPLDAISFAKEKEMLGPDFMDKYEDPSKHIQSRERFEKEHKNMKDYGAYLKKFGDKETYLVSSTAFWGYAFVSDKVDWQELRDNVNQFEWVSKFYERFIEPLSEDTLITIFECRK